MAAGAKSSATEAPPKAKAAPSSAPHRAASSHAAARKKEARKASHGPQTSGTSVSMSKKAADGGLDALGSAAGLSSGDLFARNLSVMCVAHVARGVGFDAVHKSAADALTEILAKCMQ
jgi:hypothetical protein